MGTEVLRPQDCLVERITVFPRRRSLYSHHAAHPSKPTHNKPSPARSDPKRKQSDPTGKVSRRSSPDDLKSSRNHHRHLAIGQVTILRRGEPLDLKSKADPPTSSGGVLIASGTERLGPDPSTVARQIWIENQSPSSKRAGSPVPQPTPTQDVYAGSAFVVSPEPESLPLPSFAKKKQVSVTVDASATRDLRRLLHLD